MQNKKYRRLSDSEREEISRGILKRWSPREIVIRLEKEYQYFPKGTEFGKVSVREIKRSAETAK